VRVLASSPERFELFLQKIVGDGLLYANVEDEEGRVHFQKLPLDQLTRVFLGKARAVETIKAFFFPPRTKVAEFPSTSPEEITAPKTAVVGMRACGLMALQILDRVFSEEVPDPFYQARRENSTIITCDCTEPWDTCFCTEMGYKPYPESGFDLNLSPLDGQILVEVGSEKGEALVTDHADFFFEPQQALLDQRETNRQAVLQRVKEINAHFNIAAPFQKTISQQLTSPVWAKHGVAYSCVECGACTHVCPTCRCFLLVDQKVEDHTERSMVWDVCFYPGYWRMAGNLSPKPMLLNRFQNRFSCKFDYFVDNYQAIACTGCGRCIQACMGNIDIRQCLSELQALEKVSKK
jgi:sulfhydrogenase subunit beta (sulfur reductase)